MRPQQFWLKAMGLTPRNLTAVLTFYRTIRHPAEFSIQNFAPSRESFQGVEVLERFNPLTPTVVIGQGTAIDRASCARLG